MKHLQAHVTKRPEGLWQAKLESRKNAYRVTSTQEEAIQQMTNYFKNHNGGELIIHGTDGKIRDKRTIAPMSDPFPPKG